MDYNKIGNLIMTERKTKKLTQTKLAEKLFVSEKTVSKWENGNGIPDTSVLPKLCEIFNITLNELLSGERIPKDEYSFKAEERLFEMQKTKEVSDKRLLWAEVVIGVLSTLILLGTWIPAGYLFEKGYVVIPIITMVLGLVIFVGGCLFCLYIEQVAGFYICKHCNHKYVPTLSQVSLSAHFGRIRYMKCPKCGKRSWNKKVYK